VKVLLNAGPLVNRPLTGVGQYTYQLYRELLALQTPVRFYYRYHNSNQIKLTGGEFANSLEQWADGSAVSRLSVNVARKMCFLSSSLGLGKGGIYHEPNFLPFKTHLPTVITIHDLSPLRVPETHRAKPVEIFRQRMPKAIERASRIIAVSEFTRREIIEYFPEAESKTFVTLEGVRDAYQPMNPDETAPVLQNLGLSHGRYLLAVGTLEPRKTWRAPSRPIVLCPMPPAKTTLSSLPE